MAPSPGTTSDSLLIRLKKDDAEGWERFDSFYMPLVKRWCYRLQIADREEIAQQAVERVRGAIVRFDRRQQGSFRTWLRTIVENLLKDFYRDAESMEPTLLDDILGAFSRPTQAELSSRPETTFTREG